MPSAFHRWNHALAAGLLLAGCTSTADADPAPKAQATAPAPKPAASAPAPTTSASTTLAPVSDATLSYLENLPDKKCRWVQHTPPGEPKTVITLPTDCYSLARAWKADGREALVFQTQHGFTGMEEAKKYEEAMASHRDWKKRNVWRVDLATGKSTSLSLPSRGVFETMGFDAQGRPVAIMEESYVEGHDAPPPALEVVETLTEEDTRRQLLFEGQLYDMAEDETPRLAHAFRLEKDGKWKHFETKSTCALFECKHYRDLEAFHELAPTSENDWDRAYKAIKDVPEDSPDSAALRAVRQPSDDGKWEQLETAAGPLYVWEVLYRNDERGSELTGPVRIRGDAGLVEPEGLSISGALSVAARGDVVLLKSSDGSGKSVTRLWNAKTKKLVASLNLDATFWPMPSSTPTALAGPPAAQPVEALVRTLSPQEQLAAAFRAVYGSSSERPPRVHRGEDTYEISPAALEWSGDTAMLLTLAEILGGCRPCLGAMGIHYLEPEGEGFVVKGSWPLLVEGASFGAPPDEWEIRRDLGRNPFLISKSSDGAQGFNCEWVTLTELAPGRPFLRGSFFTGYDDEGAVGTGVEGGKVTKWEGRIARPVPDRSFEVVYTGSERFTERYQLRGEEYRRVGASHFNGKCGS